MDQTNRALGRALLVGGGAGLLLVGLGLAAGRLVAGPAPVAQAATLARAQVSAGLTYDQLSETMRAFAPDTLRCVPEGWRTDGTMIVELTVTQEGHVQHVLVTDEGDLPTGMVDCVAETLRFARFPAHDLSQGEVFAYPLTFTF